MAKSSFMEQLNELRHHLGHKSAEIERLTKENEELKKHPMAETVTFASPELEAENKRLREEVAHLRKRLGI